MLLLLIYTFLVIQSFSLSHFFLLFINTKILTGFAYMAYIFVSMFFTLD